MENKIEKKNRISSLLVISIVIVVALIIAGIISFHFINSTKRALQNQLDLGQKYLTDLDYNNALLAYKEAIKINPKSSNAYLGLAEAYLGLKEYDDASDALQKAQQLTTDVKLLNQIAELKERIENERFVQGDNIENEDTENEVKDMEESENDWSVITEDKVTIRVQNSIVQIELETPGLQEVYYCNDSNVEENAAFYSWEVTFTDGKYKYNVGTHAWNFSNHLEEMNLFNMDTGFWFHGNGDDASQHGRLMSPELTVDGNKLIYTCDLTKPKSEYEKTPEGFKGFDVNDLKILSYSIGTPGNYFKQEY